MRAFRQLALVVATLSQSFAQTTLSGFQQIVGFPQSCEDAYNHPISACDPSTDFGPGHTCSVACSIALSAIQSSIQIACRDINVDPNSVIGHFFSSTGPQYVCSGIPYNEAPGTSATSSYQESTTPTGTLTTASYSATHSSDSPTIRTTALSHHSSVQSTSHSTSSTLTTASSLSSMETSASASHHASNTPAFLTTAADKGTATTFTSQSERTGSPNPDSFGGGGSPFEVSANEAAAGPGDERSFWLMIAMVILGLAGTFR